MAATSTSSFTELAAEISKNAEVLENFLASVPDIPRPSFAPGGPPVFPATPEAVEVHEAREKLLNTAKKLHGLALGPTEGLFELGTRTHELACLHAIYTYDIAAKVPLEGDTSYATIAEAIGIDEDRVMRIIRLVTTVGVFRETRPGYIAHTAISELMASKTGVMEIFGVLIHDGFPASTHLVESFEKYPQPKNRQVETAFALAYNTGVPFYDYLVKHPDRLAKFSSAMRANDAGGLFSGAVLTHGYDWDALKAKVFVDIGGSMGHTAMRIAKGSKIPSFIVQDFNPEEVARARAALPSEYEGRITFEEHDFFKPQPVKGADVYLLRWVLHNWPDEECVKILKGLVPAMKNGARVLISDIVLPDQYIELNRIHREMLVCDLQMLMILGSRERDLNMFRKLFEAADRRFKLIGTKPLLESIHSIVEAVWEE